MKMLIAAVAIGVGALASTLAFAQPTPPSRSRLWVSFAAGSGTDGVARIVGQKLSERLKQPVVVDNKAGANGQIAAEFVEEREARRLHAVDDHQHHALGESELVKELRYDPVKTSRRSSSPATCRSRSSENNDCRRGT
jgi:tripartite-type tricarboxylate transporter receptor subunit TctC